MLLKNKITLVTGASRGIGLAIALLFAKQGAIVYANARKKGSLNDIAQDMQTQGLFLIPCYFDVTDTDACKKAILEIKRTQNHLDILVNNAGIMKDALLGMVQFTTLHETFETNVFSVVNLIQLSAKLMTRQHSGSIINISSIVGINGNRGQVAYSASKGAIIALTKSASHELTPHGIRVNAVAPGNIDTDLFKSVPQDVREAKLAKIGMGRIGTPEEVANVCLFLASDLSSYVSGQIIGVDGDAN